MRRNLSRSLRLWVIRKPSMPLAGADVWPRLVDDYGIGEEPVGFDAAPRRAFDDDRHGVRMTLTAEIPS
jgi:hypothetical protein